MSRLLDALESSDRANTIVGRAMESPPHGDTTDNDDMELMTAIAAVLASVSATMAAVVNLLVVLYAS